MCLPRLVFSRRDLLFNHDSSPIGGMLSPKSDAKVEVLEGKTSHICDLFVTCCDLMKIVPKKHKKSTPKKECENSADNAKTLRFSAYSLRVMQIFCV